MVALGEHAEDRLAGGDDAVDLCGAGGGVVGEAVQLGLHALLHPGLLVRDERGVEAPVADLAGEVPDQRVPQLGGRHEVIEDVAVALAGVRGQRLRLTEPPAQQLGDDGRVFARPAQGQEHPVERGSQLG